MLECLDILTSLDARLRVRPAEPEPPFYDAPNVSRYSHASVSGFTLLAQWQPSRRARSKYKNNRNDRFSRPASKRNKCPRSGSSNATPDAGAPHRLYRPAHVGRASARRRQHPLRNCQESVRVCVACLPFPYGCRKHVLGTLEMAVRSRLEAQPGFSPPRGLARLLRAARAADLISNHRFIARHQWAFERARRRYDVAEMDRMLREGIDECIVHHTNVVPTDEDLCYNWLEHFIGALPKLRNMHAHGSNALYPSIGQTFEIIVELIN